MFVLPESEFWSHLYLCWLWVYIQCVWGKSTTMLTALILNFWLWTLSGPLMMPGNPSYCISLLNLFHCPRQLCFTNFHIPLFRGYANSLYYSHFSICAAKTSILWASEIVSTVYILTLRWRFFLFHWEIISTIRKECLQIPTISTPLNTFVYRHLAFPLVTVDELPMIPSEANSSTPAPCSVMSLQWFSPFSPAPSVSSF